jgi:hypothetical protein
MADDPRVAMGALGRQLLDGALKTIEMADFSANFDGHHPVIFISAAVARHH